MNPAAAITLAIALMDGLEAIWPSIVALHTKGEITTEELEKLNLKRKSLAGRSNGQFQGEEWKIAAE